LLENRAENEPLARWREIVRVVCDGDDGAVTEQLAQVIHQAASTPSPIVCSTMVTLCDRSMTMRNCEGSGRADDPHP
jgi:hypothetical protein